ncbi:hypothetical protein E2C01_074631 [Portunus trituberculatus]|uniref:Uncharacterized protein n=1 Tax=Portunus trituberculatus TaxID=210409 RepID=A0A5B7IDN0_PORTR|nr:hypothetical protein [Portunus trituberculatus]
MKKKKKGRILLEAAGKGIRNREWGDRRREDGNGKTDQATGVLQGLSVDYSCLSSTSGYGTEDCITAPATIR